MQEITRAQFSMLISTFIWGLAPILVGVALDYFTPLFILTMRFGIAGLTISVFLPKIKKNGGLSFLRSPKCILIGWLIAFGYLASTIGQDLTTAGLATLISTGYIVIVPFLSWKLGKKQINREIIGLSIFSLIGIFFITFNGNWNLFSSISTIGIIFLLLAAFSWGLNIILTDELMIEIQSQKELDYLGFLYASIIHTFLPFLVISIFQATPNLQIVLKVMPIFVFLGIFATILTMGLHQYALSKMGSINTTFYLLLQILVPFSYEILILRMSYSLWIITGSLIILLSMIILETRLIHKFNKILFSKITSTSSSSHFMDFDTKIRI